MGRWGNFFNQEAFGGNTELPWGMTGDWISDTYNGLSGYDHDLPVHPTFLYESLWCLLGLLVLHVVSKKAYKFKGQLFAMYIMWYGTGRFFIEMLRTDSLYLGTMKVSCLVAALSVMCGLVLFQVFRSLAQRSPRDLFADTAVPAEGPSSEEETEETQEEEKAEDTADEVTDMEEVEESINGKEN
jgi:phosphatidylglycerol:prolipoprotein diacylglycerol transferase